MVARNDNPPFFTGQRVRLLVGVLAWPACPAELRLPPIYTLARKPRGLGAADALKFVTSRPKKPGGCVVVDGNGHCWDVPVGFLASAEQ